MIPSCSLWRHCYEIRLVLDGGVWHPIIVPDLYESLHNKNDIYTKVLPDGNPRTSLISDEFSHQLIQHDLMHLIIVSVMHTHERKVCRYVSVLHIHERIGFSILAIEFLGGMRLQDIQNRLIDSSIFLTLLVWFNLLKHGLVAFRFKTDCFIFIARHICVLDEDVFDAIS